MKTGHTHRRSSAGGFTITEVMMGVMILALTVSSSLMTLRVVLCQVETVRNNTLASQVLQSEMENLRLMNWEQIQELENGEFQINAEFEQTPAQNFRRRIAVQDSTDLRQVSLEVEWTGLSGATATRRYSTYFTRNGLSDYDYRAFR